MDSNIEMKFPRTEKIVRFKEKSLKFITGVRLDSGFLYELQFFNACHSLGGNAFFTAGEA